MYQAAETEEGPVPRPAPLDRSPLSADGFVEGMRKMANSVAIITACRDGERRGVTATAVCSLSADPPMLAVCLNKSGSVYATIQDCDHFAVNVLAADQQHMADAFAGKLAPGLRFEQGEWKAGATGAPVLEGALAVFECERKSNVDAATHTLFLGLVRAVRTSEQSQPLLYHDRQYKHLN